jgi:hypothetical protein
MLSSFERATIETHPDRRAGSFFLVSLSAAQERLSRPVHLCPVRRGREAASMISVCASVLPIYVRPSALAHGAVERWGRESIVQDADAKVHPKARCKGQQMKMHELDDELVAAGPKCRLGTREACARDAIRQLLAYGFGLLALRV